MPRTRSEHFPEIQRKILKQAAAVFARVGYATSTITDLTRATRLSRGALYHYFPSKEAILCAIFDVHLVEFLNVVDRAMHSSPLAIEQLRRVTRAIVEYNVRSKCEQELILSELNQLSNRHRERMQGLERQIVDRISDLLLRVDLDVTITPANKRVYTMMYLGIINYTFAWYDPKGRVKPAEYAELATNLFLHGLPRPAPARQSSPVRAGAAAG